MTKPTRKIMLRLSIILPTYKVETWIEKCIRSLEDQNLEYSEYEIIVINDGSPDNSPKIANELSVEFPNIKVIDQQNRGLAGARNTGVRNAEGMYLLFVDPDDYVEKNTLEKLLDFVETKKLELGMFTQNKVYQNGVIKTRKAFVDETEIMAGIDLFFLRTSDSACKYLIERQFLIKHNLFFYEDIVFLEDAEWSSRIFAKATRTAYKDIHFYNYVLRSNSLVTSGSAMSDEALDSYFKGATNLKSFQQNNNLSHAQKVFINQAIAKFAILPFAMCANRAEFKKLPLIKRKLKEAGIDKLDIKGVKGMRLRHSIIFNTTKTSIFCYFLIKHLAISLKKRAYLNLIPSFNK